MGVPVAGPARACDSSYRSKTHAWRLLAAGHRFEESAGFRPFKKFHEQAITFCREKQKKPLPRPAHPSRMLARQASKAWLRSVKDASPVR